MAEENFVTLEVAIDDALYERILHAAANRGQSLSEFVETTLAREVASALAEAPVKVEDPADEE